MAIVIPFKGMRYSAPEKLGVLTAPPYDIISPDMQKRLYEADPHNVIRLEYGMDMEGDDQSRNKYTRAGAMLEEWLRSGILEFEKKPAFYIYGQEFSLKDGTELFCKGIIGLVRLEDFSQGVVLPHEETLSKAKADRFNLMMATDANFSQIYSLYLDQEREIHKETERLSARMPDIEFVAYNGLKQKLWIVDGENDVTKITRAFAHKQLFIADGHHRYETALKFRDAKRAQNPGHNGTEPYNYVMMYLADMDDPGLVVFPTHRLVGGLSSFDEAATLAALDGVFKIEKHTGADPERMEGLLSAHKDQKAFVFYTGGDYFYLLVLKDCAAMEAALPGKSAAYRGLDVSVLHTLILDRVLGIDTEDLANQTNITYTRDSAEAVALTAAGKFQCAFLLNPTKVKEIKDVSLAAEKMPQKSTYFYPKLVTGIVMNRLK